MNQLALSFDAATARAERGIRESAEHADAVEEGWTRQALGMLTAFANDHAGTFVVEQARAWAEAHGLPQPTDDRAWGAVARMALARKRIRKVGFAPTASSNGSPKTLWQRA